MLVLVRVARVRLLRKAEGGKGEVKNVGKGPARSNFVMLEN